MTHSSNDATTAAGRRLRKLVILDRIILLDDQWAELRALADEVVEYGGIDQKEMLARLEAESGQAAAPVCWTQLAAEEITTKELIDRVKGADGIITCWTNIPDEVILASPHLRYLGFWTNLVDHRVSMDLARERGIVVTSIPDYGTDSVAEMTITGMLAVTRHLIETVTNTKKGSWAYELLKTGKRVPTIDRIPQRLLRGKKLGLLGFGRVGQRVAEIAQAFRMDVAYWSRNRRPEWEARGVEYKEIDDLVDWSDIFSMHLSPYGPEHIVSRERLARLRDGSIFVNTSAGRLVDQDALWDELRTGRINAYLDVYEKLPPRKIISELTSKNNVFTYRAAWFTQEAVTYKGDRLVEHLNRFLQDWIIGQGKKNNC
jgi:glycerate dehydrogenase